MIRGRKGGEWGSPARRIQSRSCIKLNINNSSLCVERPGERDGGIYTIYPPISIYPSIASLSLSLSPGRSHNTPGPLRPWTRLHLISRIVLNHHRSSRGSPRHLGVVTVAPLLGEMLSRRWNYWFSTHEYIIHGTLASPGYVRFLMRFIYYGPGTR